MSTEEKTPLEPPIKRNQDWRKERNAEIVKLFSKRGRAVELAERFKLSRYAIYKIVRASGKRFRRVRMRAQYDKNELVTPTD